MAGEGPVPSKASLAVGSFCHFSTAAETGRSRLRSTLGGAGDRPWRDPHQKCRLFSSLHFVPIGTRPGGHFFAELGRQYGALALVQAPPAQVQGDDQIERRTGPLPALEARLDAGLVAGAQPVAAVEDAAGRIEQDRRPQAVGASVLDEVVKVGALEERKQLRRGMQRSGAADPRRRPESHVLLPAPI